MTNFEGMPSYFWLTSSRLKQPVQDDVPYTIRALRQDLLRVRNAWEECQASRERDAIYIYLTAVFDLDDRFHETGSHGTGDSFVDSSFVFDRTRSDIMARWRQAVELGMTDEEIGTLDV